MRQKLHGGERLKSRREIGRLFGKTARVAKKYPIRAIYARAERPRDGFPVLITFVVPKRRFKKAVDRNRIKRQLREAYRLEKASFLARAQDAGFGGQIAMLIMFTGNEEVGFDYLRSRMRKVLGSVDFVGVAAA